MISSGEDVSNNDPFKFSRPYFSKSSVLQIKLKIIKEIEFTTFNKGETSYDADFNIYYELRIMGRKNYCSEFLSPIGPYLVYDVCFLILMFSQNIRSLTIMDFVINNTLKLNPKFLHKHFM